MSDPDRPSSDTPSSERPGVERPDAEVGERAGVEVAIQNPGRYAGSRDLSIWLSRLLREIAPEKRSVGLLLTDDEQMAELNGRYRDLAETTDVLSFPGDRESDYLGDVVVSVPYAGEQAAAHGHDLDREMRILVLHGVLHCMGYDHDSDDGEMRRLEDELQRAWIDDR